jgi:hypothetical protein
MLKICSDRAPYFILNRIHNGSITPSRKDVKIHELIQPLTLERFMLPSSSNIQVQNTEFLRELYVRVRNYTSFVGVHTGMVDAICRHVVAGWHFFQMHMNMQTVAVQFDRRFIST